MTDEVMAAGAPAADAPSTCGECPLASRREFLTDAAHSVAAALLALGVPNTVAWGLPLRRVRSFASSGPEHAYPIPAADGVFIDEEESLILARTQGLVFAFSLACPHQRTALRWNARDSRFQCPKHKSKYRADGTFIEGKATRGMDRFAVRREDDKVLVDVDRLYREDRDAEAWAAAVVKVA